MKLDHLNDETIKEILMIQDRLKVMDAKSESRDSFLGYIKHVWPEFIEGEHHRLFAQKLEDVAKGKIKRLIVNMPPRHTKSEFASVYFPSWFMGLKPNTKFMQTTDTAELSVRFGRKVRNLMDIKKYSHVQHISSEIAGIINDDEDNTELLAPELVTQYRAAAARCNFLGLDRPDIQYAAKEVSLVEA